MGYLCRRRSFAARSRVHWIEPRGPMPIGRGAPPELLIETGNRSVRMWPLRELGGPRRFPDGGRHAVSRWRAANAPAGREGPKFV